MRKKSFLAALLSLIFPGLGQLYLKSYLDGAVFILGAGFLWLVFFLRSWRLTQTSPKALIFWFGLGIIYLYSITDAYQKSKQGKNN